MKKQYAFFIILMVISVIISVATTAYYYRMKGTGTDSNWKDQYLSIYGDHVQLGNDFSDLEDDYYELLDDYNVLVDDFNELYEQKNSGTTVVDYTDMGTPSTLIKDGTVYWLFSKLDGSVAQWQVPVETYRAYITWPDPTETHLLQNTATDELYTVKDLSNYVQPDFFSNVISTLTEENTDVEFAYEVINLKNQLVSYGTGLEDENRWPAETLTEGAGICGDTSILVASLLKAGDQAENYGLTVSLIYCDSENMNDPQGVDHVIVGIDFADGTGLLIETTTDQTYTYDQVTGWVFEI